MSEEYRVNLDIYNGPLDLLLYLIRRDEVDIHDIPIAHITAQYVQYVEMLQDLDPNLAGDFLVMAATLMEIKTRMLLPTPPPEEGGEAGVEIDPRAELVRQLLEYKAFKDAAGDLRDSAEQQSQKFPRRPGKLPAEEEGERDLEDVQVWDLLDAFSRLMTAIGKDKPLHQVIYDDTPTELHQADILDRLRREGSMTFERIFEGRTSRSEIVGLFLAMLELVRQKKVLVNQEGNFATIRVRVNPNPPDFDKLEAERAATESLATAAAAEAKEQAEAAGRDAAAAPDAGNYVANPSREADEGDTLTEENPQDDLDLEDDFDDENLDAEEEFLDEEEDDDDDGDETSRAGD